MKAEEMKSTISALVALKHEMAVEKMKKSETLNKMYVKLIELGFKDQAEAFRQVVYLYYMAHPMATELQALNEVYVNAFHVNISK